VHSCPKQWENEPVSDSVAERLALFRYLAVLKAQKPNLAKDILQQEGA